MVPIALGTARCTQQPYEADELRRSWKRCLCPIYVSGTLNGQFKRKNTERTTWEEAKPLAHTWEDAASWDGPAKVPAPLAPESPAPVPDADSGRITVERAINLFTAEFQDAATATRKKYRLLFGKLKA